MKRKAFTLIEVIIAVVIACILATLGVPAYQNFVESSKEKVCDTNLLTLKRAIDMYTREKDVVPGALSQLEDKYIRKAYASVMSGKDSWKRKLAYLIVEGPQWGRVYAAALETFGMPRLRCPSNPDSSSTSISYGLSSGVAGLTALEYKDLPDDTVIIADAGGEVFTYTGAGGSTDSKPDSGANLVPCSEVTGHRPHKKFKTLGQPEKSLRCITKNELKKKFVSCSSPVPVEY